MTIDPLDIVAEQIHNRHYPTSTRVSEWDGRFIAVSSLTKYSPTEYATMLIKREVDDDPESRKWGYIGNTLADEALRDQHGHELQVNIPLGDCGACGPCQNNEMSVIDPALTPEGRMACKDPWLLTGHMDALSVLAAEPGGWWLVVSEAKQYLYNEASEKTRHPRAQGALYLAAVNYLLEVARSQGLFSLTLSPGPYRKNGKPITIPANAQPRGVVVACGPSHASAERLEKLPLTVEDCHEVLNFYASMAKAVRDSFLAGNLDAVTAWEKQYPSWAISNKATQAAAPLPALSVLAEELEAVKIKLTPPPLAIDDREVDLLESREAELRKQILRVMDDHGEKKFVGTAFSIRRDTWEESEMPPKAGYVKPAGSKIVVTKVKTEPKKVKVIA